MTPATGSGFSWSGAGSASPGRPYWAQALTEELRGRSRLRILVDLEGVDYMSSAGLLVLQEAATTARERGARLALCSLSEPVRVAFDLAGLTGEFTIEASCDAGVARLVLP